MPTVGYTLRLDPWAPEFEGMVQVGDDLEPATVDVRVERPVWAAVRPKREPITARIAFVDGVRRIERRLIVVEGDRRFFGLLGSFGVGAVSVDSAARGAVVGFVKRLLRNYLDPQAPALLPRLEVGERTPVFLIGGRDPRYSWYVRIAYGRAIESELTGVARLEAPAARGLDEAQKLADLSARVLPRFASDSTRDPRAPQNLYPIGGLEARLKHRLGDPAVVRHAIEAQLTSEVTA